MVNSLSVFFPAYNEEAVIGDTTEKALKVLEGLKIDYEVILIDDGSKDKTGEVIDEIARQNNKIRAIHQQNGGYGKVLATGFYEARKDWVVYTDSDGQFDFGEVDKFLEKADRYQAIWGYRINRSDPYYRLLFAKGWALALWVLLGLHLKDVDCGFKMVKKSLIDEIPKLESTRGGMINAELAYKIKKQGVEIAQVGVKHFSRTTGSPTGASVRVIMRSFGDLFRLWWKLR